MKINLNLYDSALMLNLLFGLAFMSFIVDFNTYGSFSIKLQPVSIFEAYQVEILVTLVTLVVISNLVLMRDYIKHKVEHGQL